MAVLKTARGAGSIDISDFVAENEDKVDGRAQELAKRLRAILASPQWKPPMLPAVAMQLLELSRRASVELPEVVRTLESDPVLAARVLKLVQSPLYAGMSPVRSLHAAVVRLGVVGIRNAVMEAALDYKVVRAPEYKLQLEALRLHSVWTAHLGRLVARRSGGDPEFAFLCGLLHDIGIAAGLLALAEEREVPPLAQAWPAIDAIHEEVAEVVARAWKLPPEIATVLAHHHSPITGGRCHPVVATIVVAQELAESINAGLPTPGIRAPDHPREADTADTREKASAGLALSIPAMADLLVAAQDLAKKSAGG